GRERHGPRRHRQVGAAREMEVDHLMEIHPVDVVGANTATSSGPKSRIRFRFWKTASAVPWYHVSPPRICGGTTVAKVSGSRPPIRHVALTCSISDCALYCTST